MPAIPLPSYVGRTGRKALEALANAAEHVKAPGLPKFRPPWDDPAMNLRRLINLALAAFVTASLVVAPLAATAAQPNAAGMMDMSMPSDMPCCPDEQKIRDCQDCPLMAMCMLKTTLVGPSLTEALLLRQAIGTEHSFIDDSPAAGLVRPPPDHPPRS